MEQVFPFGPEDMFLDNFPLGDAKPEASSEARKKVNFSTPSSRYDLQINTDAYHTYIAHTELQEDIWNRVPFCIYFTITMGHNRLTELIN